jgi:pseudaminic acid cytidylyltransferase
VSRIALIPARQNSVRVPGKNWREFRGRPIIEYSIDCAKRTGLFDQIWVSTDGQELERIAIANGCYVYRRPPDDGSRGTQEVAREVLMQLENVDECCLIYPTCPLLVPADITRCAAVLKGHLYAMTVSTDPLADAGAVYFGNAHAFRVNAPLIDSHTVMVPMPAARVQDINLESDWLEAERKYDLWKGAK